MTLQQINHVKNSWLLVSRMDQELVGGIFYNRLFEVMPEVKPMFNRSTIPEQSKKLMTMLSYVIARLDRLDQIIEEIRRMARRHTQYGVEDRHYQAVGEALLFTLEKGLGGNWNHNLGDAWSNIYQTLANAMMAAQHEEGEVVTKDKRA